MTQTKKLFLGLVLFILIPASVRVVLVRDLTIIPGSFFYHTITFGIPFALLAIVPVVLRPFTRWMLAIGAAGYFLVTYFLMGYWGYTGGPFDIFFVLDSWSDALPTVRDVIGIQGLLFAGFILLLVGAGFLSMFLTLLRPVPVYSGNASGRIVGLTVLVVGFTLVSPSHGYLSEQFGSVLAIQEARKIIERIVKKRAGLDEPWRFGNKTSKRF